MSKKAKHSKKSTQTSMHKGCSCLHSKTKLLGIAAGVLLVLFITSLAINPFGSACPEDKITGEATSGKSLSLREAESIAVSFVNDYLVPEGRADVVETSERHGMYRIMLSFQGQEVESYITKDGEFFFPGTPLNIEDTKRQIDAMNNQAAAPAVQTAAPPVQSDELKEQLRKFNTCLAEKGMVIYGANWCGYCKQLIELLGGYDVVGDLYVECTVETELCSQNDIRGYPTIKLNGEVFTKGRSIEAFSAATGCQMS